MTVEPLKTQVVSGVRWSLTSHAGKHVLQLLSTVVLVTLLEPADFGLVSMAMVFVGLGGLLHDLGTPAAVIQRRESSEKLLCSIFWINIVLGVIGACVLIGLAPLIGLLYREPGVTPLVMAMASTFLISAPGAVPGALLRRTFAFNRLARVELAGTASGAVVGITSALFGYGAWSLVFQVLTSNAITTLGLWSACSWRPRMLFSWIELRGVAGFSLNLTGFTVLNYFIRRADYLLIGSFLGATALGIYTLAYKLMLTPIQSISAVIGRVTFPAYAKIQDDNVRLARAFTRVAVVIATVTFPMMIGVMVTAEPLVLAAFGEKWKPVALLLVILAPVGLIQSVLTSVGGIYLAKGRTGLLLAWGVGSGVVVMAAFAVGIRHGIVGMSLAYAAATFALAWPSLVIPLHLIDLPVRRFLAPLRRPLACGICMGIVVAIVRVLLPDGLSEVSTLVACVTSGVVAYLAGSLVFNHQQTRELLQFAIARAS